MRTLLGFIRAHAATRLECFFLFSASPSSSRKRCSPTQHFTQMPRSRRREGHRSCGSPSPEIGSPTSSIGISPHWLHSVSTYQPSSSRVGWRKGMEIWQMSTRLPPSKPWISPAEFNNHCPLCPMHVHFHACSKTDSALIANTLSSSATVCARVRVKVC